jgi:hypothetical protein
MFYSTPLNDITNKYNYIHDIIKTNRNDETVYFNTNLMDEETANELNKVIVYTITNCRNDSTYTISQYTNDKLSKLIKSLGTGEFKIEYGDIQEYQVRFSLKGAISKVLESRSSKLYHNMLNRTF